MSTEDVKKKRIRSGYRGSTTRLLSEVDTALEATPLDCDKLSQLKMCLNEKLQTLKQLDAEIVELVDEAELEAEIDGAGSPRQSGRRKILLCQMNVPWR